MKDKQKIFVGLSGGVDSSVAAALLLDQGYEVTGVYMKNWSQGDSGNLCCTTDQDAADARLVAKHLGIKFCLWNFEREYQDKVMSYFYEEYAAGRTPNPDVACNREIKFKLFLDRALSLGADKVATGHYARIDDSEGAFKLLKGLDSNKDQSYFLCQLTQTELSKTLFPIGALTKPEVRIEAEKRGLITAKKKDSQGLCFVGQINVKEFLKTKLGNHTGQIFDSGGKLMGQHDGLAFYTIGQREGLSMLSNGPWYVVDKNIKDNILIVSKNQDDELLWRKSCILENISWTNKVAKLPLNCDVSVRYRSQVASATLSWQTDKIKVEFKDAQRAITPGQLAVFYQGEELIGSGVIYE